MGEDWPAELLVTVTFEVVEGRTKLTLRNSGIMAGHMSDLTEAGWKESFNKLATTLSDIC
jgi:Activator of Hsp90 ATPase homolog 1-like protein